MKLTLWTTPLLQDIIQNFYVKFIKEIEKFIMGCDSWEDIKDLIESIIDNGEFKFGKYMKYIDVSKKRKNLQPQKHFEKKNNGYRLILTEDMIDSEITEWCKETNLPDYLCVNEIKEMKNDDFIKKYGEPEIVMEIFPSNTFDESLEKCIKWCSNNSIEPPNKKWIDSRILHKDGETYMENIGFYENAWKKMLIKDVKNNKNKLKDSRKRRFYVAYDDEDQICISVRYIKNKNKSKTLPYNTTDYIHSTPYFVNGDIVKYSVLKEEYKQQNTDGYTNEDCDDFIEDGGLPSKYYWKTPDGWLYLFDKDKPEIISLNIIVPSKIPLVIPSNSSNIPVINEDVLLFTNTCCKITDKPNLRFGLKNIYTIYETWCKLNKKKCLKTQKKFKEELEKLNYKEVKSKGVDMNNNPGKRGYNIMVAL
jgi:hypothetical protein